MISETLRRAREYEKEFAAKVPESQRPLFHVTAPVGWINDPNGFSEYKGYYHLFYQYHPYSTHWGPMHWGHVRTRDFVSWENLPVALAPDAEYDSAGCFSGSAITLPDGRQLLMYTSVTRVQDGEKSFDRQQQSIAVGDGLDYEKIDANPVISTAMIPEGNSREDFRDPKIIQENDKYYALIGSRPSDGSGEILLFESYDLRNWQYRNVVARCENEYGRMWECPDYFELDGKQILIVSPQDMKGDGKEFHPGNGTVLFVGEKNEDLSFKRESAQTLDFGMDFYAPQTLETYDGRRVMIGWMQNWDTCNVGNEERMIYGQMTIPRELSINNGRVCQNPVRELENYHGKDFCYQNAEICGEKSFSGIRGRCLDLTVSLDLTENAGMLWFKIELCKDKVHSVIVKYDASENTLRLDRSRSGGVRDIVNIREFEAPLCDNRLKLRIIMDRYSIELFAGNGEKSASMNVYTPLEAQEIVFSSDKRAVADICGAELVTDAIRN